MSAFAIGGIGKIFKLTQKTRLNDLRIFFLYRSQIKIETKYLFPRNLYLKSPIAQFINISIQTMIHMRLYAFQLAVS